MHLLLLILDGISAFVLAFVACELGQRLADTFENMHATIDQFNWYLFPSEIKKMLPMIHVIAQQPVSVECFGSIKCTRDVFKNVSLY